MIEASFNSELLYTRFTNRSFNEKLNWLSIGSQLFRRDWLVSSESESNVLSWKPLFNSYCQQDNSIISNTTNSCEIILGYPGVIPLATSTPETIH